ncbi:ABC transporter permease [Spirosoma arboris]|uniref:ABC transporter permease n=1 Tax=Spirosoma arboris TaxID=2682092 RepID=UPI0018DBC6B5|nr:ABC transporter permease [Spirosoma arboris]
MKPNFFYITQYDLAFLVAISIVLNFAMLLGFTRKANRATNRLLAAALTVAALWMANSLAVNIRLAAYVPVFSLAFGPFIFFYVLKLTKPVFRFHWKDLLHFIPALVEQFLRSSPLLPFLAFISGSIYLYCAHRLIERFYQSKPFHDGDRYRYEFRWLHRLLKGFGLLWILWIPFWASGNDELLCILLMAMLIWIAARAFLRPEIGVRPDRVPISRPLVLDELKQKGSWMKKAVKEKRYYEDPELSLGSLAEKLGVPAHELSRVLNTVFKKSFNQFINEYRVQEAIRKMQDPAYDHITLLGIAYDSGFNSQSTFSRFFKHFTGKSPVDYKNGLKKDCSTYKLTSYGRFATTILPEKSNRNFMFKNHLTIARRNMLRNKGTAFINIAGLSIGMAATILIMLWVQNELSFDRYQPDIGDLYRIKSKLRIASNETWLWETSQYILGDNASGQIPEINMVARLKPRNNSDLVLHYQQKIIAEKKSAYVDEQWFNMFHYDFINGSSEDFSKNPFSLILTSTAAKRYFGTEPAVGKVVRIDRTTYQVRGVVKDNPANSSFQYDVLIPMAARLSNPDDRKNASDWGNYNYITFLKLRTGANPVAVSAKLTQILRANEKNRDDKSDYSLLKVEDMHFENDLERSAFNHGSRTMVNVFIVLGLLLLSTACINYVNLTTARASVRSKEVSIRKLVGAEKMQLFGQFMAESFLISVLSLAAALLLVELSLPWFESFTGKEFDQPLYIPSVWLVIAVTLLISFLLNGIYPAALLSSFQPLHVFKGRNLLNFNDSSLRKTLVVIQFTISVILITGTVIIYCQLRYVQTKDIGYDRSQVFTFTFPYWTIHDPDLKKPEVLLNSVKQALKQEASIADVTTASTRLTDFDNQSSSFDWEGKPNDFKPVLAPLQADPDFQRMMRLKIAEGRWFNSGIADQHNVLLNETAVQTLQLQSPIIGRRFMHQGDTGVIIGVVKDFNYKSLREKIGPMVITNQPSGGFYIKTTVRNTSAAILAAQKIWKKFFPDDPFDYEFLDDNYTNLYKTEQQSSVLFTLFAGIALVVSALGLLGLAAFAAEQKVKEIGIRKVLGASVQQIVGLLTIDFVKLVLLASILAFPIAWWAMNEWLQDFAYKITLSWWIFALSGAIALTIALLTVSYQAIKAAVANPVKSLQSE